MSRRQSPFPKCGPGRPELSAAEKRHRDKCKRLADKLRRTGVDAAYYVVSESGKLWGAFAEFSGWSGAKRALDLSSLPVGSVVLRSDGVELARRHAKIPC
jgi:hypothetical protein